MIIHLLFPRILLQHSELKMKAEISSLENL